MENESIEVSAVIPADPYRIYQAYLNGLEHAAMTGGAASIEPWPGGRFTAWDGYISGTTLDVDPSRRILQSWRTADFPPEAPDSRVEITLEAVEGGTRLAITHSDIPKGQGRRYASGWHDYYLNPMIAYFSAATPREGAAAAQATVKAPRRRRRRPTVSERPTRRPASRTAKKKPAAKKPAAKKTARKPAKKTAKKPAAKKTTRKPAKKSAAKKTARKPAKKTAKKPTAKKTTRKPAKKSAAKKTARKPAKKTAKKPTAQKTTRKPAKKSAAKKTARKPAKKTAKKPAAKKPAAKKRRGQEGRQEEPAPQEAPPLTSAPPAPQRDPGIAGVVSWPEAGFPPDPAAGVAWAFPSPMALS